MKRHGLPSALVLALALCGCQTLVVTSHRDPSVERLTFDRTLAVVNLSDGYGDPEQSRRTGEMELVNRLSELNVVPSYRDYSLDEVADIGSIKLRAAEGGFDGLVLLWITGVHVGWTVLAHEATLTEISAGEATPYTHVDVTAAVVSLAKDREMWNGVIERRYDEGTKKDVRAIVRAVARQLRADHLID